MIGALRGTISAISGQEIIVMAGGVGYQVAVTNPGSYTTGDTIELFTYLAVRETALDLYGFTTIADKELFELLLSVPKIGPKSALQVMTQAEPALLLECIGTEDPSRLHKQTGIGKKTCENIVSNLHDKIENLSLTATTPATTNLSGTQADAIDALISLGFDPKSARTAVLKQSDPELSVSELVAAALK